MVMTVAASMIIVAVIVVIIVGGGCGCRRSVLEASELLHPVGEWSSATCTFLTIWHIGQIGAMVS